MINDIIKKYKKYLRYGVSGLTATFVNLGLLYILTDIANIWYIASAVVSFVASFLVSFTMQKFWTFQDNSCKKIKKQAFYYFLVAICGLCLNTSGIYILVDKFKIGYLWAQIIMSAIISVGSFLMYNGFVFNNCQKEEYEVDNSKN